MKDKISIAMTTYNGVKYLREQLDSLYCQTLLADEIVVVDDCSTDDTVKILEEYHRTKELKYYVNERNIGVNKNFEKALTLCQGDYIALCDQDDVWFPSKIEKSYKQIKLIEKEDAALVSSRNVSTDENLNILSKGQSDIDSDNYITTLFGHRSQGSSLMMNRTLLKYILPIPKNEKMVFDLYIGLIAAMVGSKFNIGEPLMYYRHHSTNVLAKINVINKSRFARFLTKYCNKYPGLVPDERFPLMEEIKKKHFDNFKKERTELFLKILSLKDKSPLMKSLQIIFSIEELSFRNKIIYSRNAIISSIIHLFNICR